MSVPFSAAANAYTSATKLADPKKSMIPDAGMTTPQGQDFAQLLAGSVNGVVESGRVADQKGIEMLNGKSNVVDVVTAISETEVALQTMVTVRDRVISAYEEIMRMPI
jgi:flagellar hook-basal body complex protein FliE